jgi:hypothetical protein
MLQYQCTSNTGAVGGTTYSYKPSAACQMSLYIQLLIPARQNSLRVHHIFLTEHQPHKGFHKSLVKKGVSHELCNSRPISHTQIVKHSQGSITMHVSCNILAAQVKRLPPS